MTPTALSMIFGTVQEPLGLVMLVITGLVATLFVTYALWLQSSVQMETRRMTRELASQRQLADQVEVSPQGTFELSVTPERLRCRRGTGSRGACGHPGRPGDAARRSMNSATIKPLTFRLEGR